MIEKMYGDTNIAMRLLVGDKDIEKKDEKNESIVTMVEETKKIAHKVYKGELVLEFTDTVITEMVYVMDKIYDVSREDISRLILSLLEVDGVESSTVMKMALRKYPSVKEDIVDIQLAVLSQQNKFPVLSWDKGYKHLDCEYKTPSDLNNPE